MPCILAADQTKIPLGQYGSSNIAQAKTVYRRGLGNRYGRLMQTISGIHYNFLCLVGYGTLGKFHQQSQTDAYFGMIQISPVLAPAISVWRGSAVCRSFVNGSDHGLESFNEGSLYLPHATSLRMGRLGYQRSTAPLTCLITPCRLCAPIRIGLTESYPDYAAIRPGKDQQHPQLNDAVLQIENEFYGTIRPKRTTRSGERPRRRSTSGIRRSTMR